VQLLSNMYASGRYRGRVDRDHVELGVQIGVHELADRPAPGSEHREVDVKMSVRSAMRLDGPVTLTGGRGDVPWCLTTFGALGKGGKALRHGSARVCSYLPDKRSPTW